MSDYVTLTAGDTLIRIFCAEGRRPEWLYWGRKLADVPPQSLTTLDQRPNAPGNPDVEVAPSLLNGLGAGWAGPPGFCAHRQGRDWASQFVVRGVYQSLPNTLELLTEDPQTQIAATHRLSLHPQSEVLSVETEIENIGTETLTLDWCSVLCVPVDPALTGILGFTGRWADEFQTQDIDAFQGTYLRENRAGRTSHDTFPGLILRAAHTSQSAGPCIGFHLGWSGNHRLRLDRLSDGRVQFMAGEYFWPGEMQLAPGARYTSPKLYMAHSMQGQNDLSHKFHTHVRMDILRASARSKPRPVHFNTWEAVYFNQDEDTLKALADCAGDLGVERFVLDDGWFGARRNDRTGLGDWRVSRDIYPDGLGPLIAHVNASGMEFGLWVEPEMVNPDSDLYRAHPDWILQAEGVPQLPSRGQYVLDFTRPEVVAHIYAQLDGLLRDYAITYLKWDMNRNIQHPGSRGYPAAHQQVHHVYTMIDRLKARHPGVEIESCASGGGRADYGILARTDRIWTSDSNDALDRQAIQRGASYFFPLDVLGTHIGPRRCHITGRELTLGVRAATALFGHMGLELDVRSIPEAERAQIRSAITFYKTHRALLHSGRLYRLDTGPDCLAMGVVDPEGRQALYSYCQIATQPLSVPGRLYPLGLDADRVYRLRLVWPGPIEGLNPPSQAEAIRLPGDGRLVSGAYLQNVGLQLPLMPPQVCLLLHFEAESPAGQ